jgi:eukaryotic-like serine/threonine-protein kinase
VRQLTTIPGDNTHIGTYRVIRTLKVAASNEVVLAVNEGPHGDEEPVVIKRLLPGFDGEPWRTRSLTREALAYARVSHPSVLRLYDFLSVDGLPAMVLEFVDGMSLAEMLEALRERGRRLPRPLAFHIAGRLFAALAAAHAACDPDSGLPAPVIHRDVSPGNVLLTREGEVKLSDFGVAHLGNGELETQSELLKGTWGYMAPEQVREEKVTVRTDLYCAALVVRELLTGVVAFPRCGQTHLAYLQEMAAPWLTPMRELELGLSPRLLRALDSALEPEPAARRVTAEELHTLVRAETAWDGARSDLATLVLDLLAPEVRMSLPPNTSRRAFDTEVVQDVDVLLAAMDRMA